MQISPRVRGFTTFIVILAIILTIGGVGAAVWFSSSRRAAEGNAPILVTATQGEFVSQVLDQGEIQSSENVEIRCEVRPAGGSISVLEVVPEGTMIINTVENPRDEKTVLCRLDSKSFETEYDQQKLAVNAAVIAVSQAQAEWDAAKVTRREYLEGIHVQNRKEIENEIYNAQQEVEQAEAYLEHSTKLHKKNFITTQQLKGDRIAVQRAKNSYELALQKLKVLQEVTLEKETIKLDSDIRAAEVKFENEKEKLRIEETQLADIQMQIKNCTIYPPKGVNGQVVYNKETGRGGQTEWVLIEGATVRERQVLIRIPNPSKMEVRALINEQSITAVRPGMPVSIKVDALHNVPLSGKVTTVSQYAQQGDFMSSSIKKFPVIVQIENPPAELKPGMNASAAIQTLYVENAIQVPVQCVYAAQDSRYCLVQKGKNEYATVEVKILGSNSKNVCIESGISAGDQVVMNPGSHRELLNLPNKPVEKKIEAANGDTGEDVPAESSEPNSEPMDPNRGPPSEGDGAEGDRPGRGDGERGEGGRGQGRRGNRGDGAGGGEREGGDGGQGGMRGGNPEQMIDGMLQRMDTNGDGVLEESELEAIPEGFRDRMKSNDADGDGKITRDELMQGMQRMMEERMRDGGGPPGGE